MVNKGKSKNRIVNGDYNLENENDLFEMVEESNSVNGLQYKSSFNMGIDQELKKGNVDTRFNRYHYQNFFLCEDYKNISESSLKFDSLDLLSISKFLWKIISSLILKTISLTIL